MKKKILVFDTHPVQYRVPIYQRMNAIWPGCLHVVYASDCSVRGYLDKDFGQAFAWDDPLLLGYDYTLLHNDNGEPLQGWNSLTGKGIRDIIRRQKPAAILLTGLNYRYDVTAYLAAISQGIPLWLRYETQDLAFPRTKWKSFARSLLYRAAYKPIGKFFYIGELNRQHYLAHGVLPQKLRRAPYATVNRFAALNDEEKKALRRKARTKAGLSPTDFVVGFSGKLIAKKHPDLLFQMLPYLPASLRHRTALYFIGSGPLQAEIKQLADDAQKRFGVQSFFTGFVNQSQLAEHYLAMDMMVLPSRQMGETWGLVVNEAMQAGCSVAVSSAVGSSADFRHWERFRVFDEANAQQLAGQVEALAYYPTQFNWAVQQLKPYSIEAVADALIAEIGLETPAPELAKAL